MDGSAGFWAIDKPTGITSQRALTIAKRQLGVKKAGHSGTLDPLATGLLLIATGSWSRLLAFVIGESKTYWGVIRCGLRTDSLDITGAVVGFSPVGDSVDAQRIELALDEFRGAFLQMPPALSALKVDGVRAYERTRRGEAVALEARSVTITSIDSLGIARSGPFLDVSIRVRCSSGTYIRSIARDLGERLGTGATLLALRREAIGSVTVEAARDPGIVTAEDRLALATVFPNYGYYEVGPEVAIQARHGHPIACPSSLAGLSSVLVLEAGIEPEYRRLIGIYQPEGDRLRAARVVPVKGVG